MKFVIAALIFVMTAPARAASVITVHLPWARPIAQGGTAEVYVDLMASDGARLIGVSSAIAKRVELRGPGVIPGPSPSIALAPGNIVHLKSDATRIALIGTVRALRIGDYVPLTLTIQRRSGSVERLAISAEVRRASAVDEEAHEHRHAG